MSVVSYIIESYKYINTSINKTDGTMKENNRQLQQSITTLKCRLLENRLCIRGIPEQDSENIFKFIVEKVANLFG